MTPAAPTGTRRLVDPELLPLLDMFPTVEMSDALLPESRRRFGPMPAPDEVAARVEKTVRAVPGPPGAPDVRVVIYRPLAASGPAPCLLHLHGGGYIAGVPEAFEPQHAALAAQLGCVIVSVDYRLAPETRAPGQVEDAYAVLAWLNRHTAELQVDTARIGVAGESAGGGLAAALALLARDRGEYGLAFQHLMYPMLDDRTCTTAEPNPCAGEFIWPPASNRYGWASLLGVEPGSEGVSPYAAPARAADLAGLPPTYIAVGALDLFVDEDLEYARRLIRAGVPTELHVLPGAYHGFDLNPAPRLSVASGQNRLEALARAMGRR